MSTLQLLFAGFFRIRSMLPQSLRQSVFRLFAGMVALGFLEIAGIMSLSFFAVMLNAPESLLQSRIIDPIVSVLPFTERLLENTNYIILYAVIPPIVLIILKNIFSACIACRISKLGSEVAAYAGCEIMNRFMHMPYEWHLSSQGSEAFTKVSWRFALGHLLAQSLVAYSNFIVSGLLFLGLLVYAPELTALVLSVMAVSSVLLYKTIRKHIDTCAQAKAEAQQEENAVTLTAMRGIREILIYQQQATFLHAIRQSMRKSIRPQTFLNVSPSIPGWTLEATGFLLIGLALAWMVLVQHAERLTITSNIAMLTLTAWRILPLLNRAVGAVVSMRSQMSTGIPCLEYLESLAAAPQEDQTAAVQLCVREGITLHDVWYRYPNTDEDILRGVTLCIPHGKRVGIVGVSGAGKSTLMNILAGLIRPSQGEMRVDGAPLTVDTLSAYRRGIGYVPQNPYLMPGTVAENIALSRWRQPIDEQRLRAACAQACIDFVGRDGEQVDRAVGEDGAGLSGGQAQRVTIARALYAAPSVLIFDEATSSLDHNTEENIQRTIDALPRGITQIVVSHKQSALRHCDSICWIEDGTVKSGGEAEELLSSYFAAHG